MCMKRVIAQPAVVTVNELPSKTKNSNNNSNGRRDEFIERSGGLYSGTKGPVCYESQLQHQYILRHDNNIYKLVNK